MALFSRPTARVLAILDLLMANPSQGFGLTEMTRRLGLNKERVKLRTDLFTPPGTGAQLDLFGDKRAA